MATNAVWWYQLRKNAVCQYIFEAYLEALFPLAAPYQLPNFRHQQIHGSYCLVIGIQPHVKRL